MNGDYPDSNITLDSHIVNCDIQAGYGLTRFNAGQLLEAYKEGKVSGKLKEITATLNEEDNGVLMLLKFK